MFFEAGFDVREARGVGRFLCLETGVEIGGGFAEFADRIRIGGRLGFAEGWEGSGRDSGEENRNPGSVRDSLLSDGSGFHMPSDSTPSISAPTGGNNKHFD